MKNKICRRAGLAAKTCACIFSVMIFSASAQDAIDVEIQLPPDVVLTPGVAFPSGLARPSSGTNKTAEAKSPEERQLQELLKLKFVRTAPAILDALANQFDERKALTNEVERFKQRIIVGDWMEVGKFLRGLTNDHGKQVYRYLLKELPNAGKSSGPPNSPQPDQPMMPPQGQGPANSAAPALVATDLLALAEIAPHPLEDEDAKLLGQLLKRLLTRGDALEPLLPKLEAGVRGLGGSDAADRHRAGAGPN